MNPTLDDLIALARHAGGILRDGYGQRHEINHKGAIDLVTEVDHRSEAYLLEQIGTRFPGQTIETEESGLLSGSGEARWYIDPLDGTTNYAHAVPIFSVSIAFANHGDFQLGVIYDPMRDDCFCAERGRGAWLNGQPIHVSEITDLSRSLVVTGFPYEGAQKNIPNFAHFTGLTQGVRRLGSAALDLCYIAAGRFEGYWEITLKPWDFAAGALIVQEAGGRITDLDGNPDLLRPPYSILAGNPAIHEQMLREFQSALP